MSDRPTPPPQEGGEQQRRIQLRDAVVPTHYASFFSIAGGPDAVLLTFGNQFGSPDTIQLEQKIVLSPANAKRMAISLGQVIRRHEEQHGEIDISVRRPPEQPPGAGIGDTGAIVFHSLSPRVPRMSGVASSVVVSARKPEKGHQPPPGLSLTHT